MTLDLSAMSDGELVRFATKKERKPIPKVRVKPRPGRLKGKKLTDLRTRCWERDEGKCVDCGDPIPLEGDVFTRMHMAHVQNKRMYGDNLDNVRSKCYECHIVKEHNAGGKPCPPKPSN